jgi:hypothetical protein
MVDAGGSQRLPSHWPTCAHALSRLNDDPRGRYFALDRRTNQSASLAQLAAPVAPGGPSSTVGTYSNSWSPPSKVRLSTRSSLMSGYPS